MNLYRTLNGEVFDLDELPAKQKSIYAELKSSYDVNAEWTKFTNLWVAKVREVFGAKEPSEIVEEPIYKICQDLDSRLGIRQGHTREPDYQDLLADVINIHFGSRYQFCKQTGIDEGYLSSILNRKKNPSLKMLQGILGKINYRIRFVEQAREPNSYNEASGLSTEALKTRNSSGSALNWSMTDDAKWITLSLPSGATDTGTDATATWVDDNTRQGIGWSIATVLLGIGVVVSPHPLSKLVCSIGAIGTGTKAVDCFTRSAEVAYQQLAAQREYRQLPAHV